MVLRYSAGTRSRPCSHRYCLSLVRRDIATPGKKAQTIARHYLHQLPEGSQRRYYPRPPRITFKNQKTLSRKQGFVKTEIPRKHPSTGQLCFFCVPQTHRTRSQLQAEMRCPLIPYRTAPLGSLQCQVRPGTRLGSFGVARVLLHREDHQALYPGKGFPRAVPWGWRFSSAQGWPPRALAHTKLRVQLTVLNRLSLQIQHK